MKNMLTGRMALDAISAKGDNWYSVKNAVGDTAEVLIYNEIGYYGATAEDFLAEIKAIFAPNIIVRINSIGGSVFDGIGIYNALRSHPSHVTTQVDALAASIASVIAQAGDHRVMLQHSQMMIHEAAGIAIGSATDMKEFSDILDRQTDLIADIYAQRAGEGTKDYFRGLMAAQTWFSDVEAVEEGLADEVVVPSKRATTATQDSEPEGEDAVAAKGIADFAAAFKDGIDTAYDELEESLA